MNLTNIKAKQEVQSYKALCSLLDEPIKTSNAKKAQLKEWERYFKFHKKKGDRYVIVIDEIYETPLPERMRVDDIYSALVQVILCDYLRMPDKLVDGSLIVTKKQLYEICGMVNERYVVQPDKDIAIEDFERSNQLTHQSSKWLLNEFNMRVNSRLSNIIYKVLTRLKKKKYIMFDDYFVITEKVNGVAVKREANGHERNAYLNICQKVKNEQNITYINDYNSKEFYNAVRKKIQEEYRWDDCYQYIRINYADNFTQINYELSKKELMDELNKNKEAVNEHIVSMFERLVREDYKKNRSKVIEMKQDLAPKLAVGKYSDSQLNSLVSDREVSEACDTKVLHENYVQLQQQLIDIFIRLIKEEEIQELAQDLEEKG